MRKRPPRNGDKKTTIQNTLLVDGNALFKTAFFGAKSVFNTDGHHVGGLLSFFTILRMVLVDGLYHKVYVFWDGNFSGKLRYEIYNPYKSDRGKDFINGTEPNDISELTQRKIVWEYINEMFIRQIKDEIVESDDFIAYYCLNKKPNEKITIISNDRDFCQLISNDIRIYFLDLKKYVDNSNFSEYFRYHQKNSVLFKTIIGDKSDSIKGIKGISGDSLINLFPSMAERELTLKDIINEAIVKQEQRKLEKKPPLKVLTNIIEGVTSGVQKDKVYEINEKLVNLKKPLMTPNSIREVERLINGTLDSSGRDLKNVFMKMKRDGLDKIIGENRYADFLIPFKNLINRENNN